MHFVMMVREIRVTDDVMTRAEDDRATDTKKSFKMHRYFA